MRVQKKTPADWPLVLLLVLLTAFHLSGFEAVPFHPDEATQLYMSSEFDDLLARPLSLAWTPDGDDPRLAIRLLDAPMTRYLLGLGRSLAGIPARRETVHNEQSIFPVAERRQLACSIQAHVRIHKTQRRTV